LDVASPWRRLHWTLPLALLICALAFLWFAYSMSRPAQRTAEPPPVDAQLVEIPAPAAAPAAAPPAPPQQHAAPHPVRPQMPLQPAPAPATPTVPAAPASPPPPAASPAPPAAPNTAANNAALTASRGAQAIVRPLPVIPDDLREDALNETATARFHIAADGSATVELVKPTQNPRLNRLLLETLRQWRFFPAMQQGKPVESTQEMVIKVEVK